MKKRILIIEDDKDITEALRYNLEKDKGFTVSIAHTGDEGLNLALQTKPHCVLLDIGLPGLSGYEICRMLRADAETREIPILMLTVFKFTRKVLQKYSITLLQPTTDGGNANDGA